MAVHTVVRRIQLASHKPLCKRLLPNVGRMPGLEPLQLARPALPVRHHIAVRSLEQGPVLDVRLSLERGVGREIAMLGEEGGNGLGHGQTSRRGR